MRWSLNDVNNLTQERLMSLSEKELGQLDRFLSDVTRKRLQYTQALGGVSPAERTLQQAGILTNNVHEATGLDRNAKIARVAKLKNVSNMMTFRNPNYNPAGVRVSTSFDKQIAIINTDFEADMSTDVLATSFFRNEAEL